MINDKDIEPYNILYDIDSFYENNEEDDNLTEKDVNGIKLLYSLYDYYKKMVIMIT